MEEVEGDDEEEEDISQSLTVLPLKDAHPDGESSQLTEPRSVVAACHGSDAGALNGVVIRQPRRNRVYEKILPLPQEEDGENAHAESSQDLHDDERAAYKRQQQSLPLPQEEDGENAHAKSSQDLHDEERAAYKRQQQIFPLPQEEVGDGAQAESCQDLEDYVAGKGKQNLPFPQQVVGESARAAPIAEPQEEDPVDSVNRLSDHEFDEILQEYEEKLPTRDLEDQLNCVAEIMFSSKFYHRLPYPETCFSCHKEEIEVVVLPCGHKYACRACFHRHLIHIRPFKCLICHCMGTSHEFL